MQRRDFLKIVAAATVCPSLMTTTGKSVARAAITNYAALPTGDLYAILKAKRQEATEKLLEALEDAWFRPVIIKTELNTFKEHLDFSMTNYCTHRTEYLKRRIQHGTLLKPKR